MTTEPALADFLVISRGQWDKDKSPAEIQRAIDAFYVWLERLIESGQARHGQRLAREARFVSRHGVTDGPYAESKEVIGGYWFFMAPDLAAAAALAAQNPCLACGLGYEIRPVELERCSATQPSCESAGLTSA